MIICLLQFKIKNIYTHKVVVLHASGHGDRKITLRRSDENKSGRAGWATSNYNLLAVLVLYYDIIIYFLFI